MVEPLAAATDASAQELREARHIFDRILEAGSITVPNARIVTRAEDMLNGDLVICEENPLGEQMFLVGDFAGHGLCAALGTIIASQIFRAMVRKELSLEQIARELDLKVSSLLPTGRFLAAALIAYEPASGRLQVWNATVPDVLVWRPAKGVIHTFPSTHPPLGVLGKHNEAVATTVELQPGDRVLGMTDGLVEACGANGTMLGREWLLDLLDEMQTMQDEAWLSDDVLRRFEALGASASDDTSILELRCVVAPTSDTSDGEPEVGWEVSAVARASSLRAGRIPLRVIQLGLEELDLAPRDLAAVSMVFSELISNALDHGLLGLASELKMGEDGPLRYHGARAEALKQLERGALRLTARRPETDLLELSVAHDGHGFDPAGVDSTLDDCTKPFGRGIALVKRMTEALEYREGGREAVAFYRLSAG